MPIPETQLETWTHIGAQQTAKDTADSIRGALANYSNWPEDIEKEDYLQGSYKNSTNIRGDSDVDLVVQLNSIFYNNLTNEEIEYLNLSSSSYNFIDFRNDVLEALRSRFGRENVSEGNKSIKLKASSGRLAADIIACVQYRKYNKTFGLSVDNYIEGMTFWTKNNYQQIINYPKLHYDNGCTKNANANRLYKKTVRMFKNIRTYLVEKEKISEDLAPSYFLECFLFNVPNGKFNGNYQNIFANVVNNLNDTELDKFICQNEQELLFRVTDDSWRKYKAEKLISKIITLWNNW